jgi:hypothetical protein
MDKTLMHADAFFFITAIAIVVVTPLIIIAGIYAIRILKDAREMMQRVKEESDAIMKDVQDARAELRRESRRLKELLAAVPVVGGVWQEAKRPRKKTNTTTHGKKSTQGRKGGKKTTNA